jgi:hypothetical protein
VNIYDLYSSPSSYLGLGRQVSEAQMFTVQESHSQGHLLRSSELQTSVCVPYIVRHISPFVEMEPRPFTPPQNHRSKREMGISDHNSVIERA